MTDALILDSSKATLRQYLHTYDLAIAEDMATLTISVKMDYSIEDPVDRDYDAADLAPFVCL